VTPAREITTNMFEFRAISSEIGAAQWLPRNSSRLPFMQRGPQETHPAGASAVHRLHHRVETTPRVAFLNDALRDFDQVEGAIARQFDFSELELGAVRF